MTVGLQGAANLTRINPRWFVAPGLTLNQHAYNVATRVSGGYKEATAAITGVASALLLGMGALRVLSGRLSLGDLLVFLGYLTALYGPVSALSSAVGYAVAVGPGGSRTHPCRQRRSHVRIDSWPADGLHLH